MGMNRARMRRPWTERHATALTMTSRRQNLRWPMDAYGDSRRRPGTVTVVRNYCLSLPDVQQRWRRANGYPAGVLCGIVSMKASSVMNSNSPCIIESSALGRLRYPDTACGTVAGEADRGTAVRSPVIGGKETLTLRRIGRSSRGVGDAERGPDIGGNP